MSYRQLREPNLNQTDQPGWCLRLVLRSFGFPYGAEYARAEWDRNGTKHTDALPSDVAVPVFYTWTGTIDGITRDWGDVAIYVPGRGVFGTPQRGSTGNRWDTSVEARRAWLGGNAKYLGWTETLNATKLIEPVVGGKGADNMPTLIDEEGVRILGASVLERGDIPVPTSPDLLNHVGGDALAKLKEFWYSTEGKAAHAWRLSIRGQLAELQKVADELKQRPTQENFNALQAQLKVCSTAIDTKTAELDKLQQEKAADTAAGDTLLRRLGQMAKKYLPW